MATDYYVDNANGVDTNPGTFALPFASLDKGLLTAQSAQNDRIIVRSGIYQEPAIETDNVNVPIIGYDGDDVTIDGQGTQQALFASVAPPTAGVTMLQNLKLVNYTVKPFSWMGGMVFKVDNVFFKPAAKPGSKLFSGGFNGQFSGVLQDITAVGHEKIFDDFASLATGALITNCIFFDYDTQGMTLNGDAKVSYSGYEGATGLTNKDVLTEAPGFVNAAGGNYALAASSTYRGAGEKGTNIGATFQPALRVGTGMFNLFNPPDWENDPLWWDTTLNAGAGGAGADAIAAGATPGPAIFQAGKWQIDTGSVANATSARIRSKVYALATTKTVKNIGWGADEDTTPASGSKLVIDNSLATATREIEFRGSTSSFLIGAASPSWNLASKASALSLQASFLQVRMLMTTVGV